MTHHERPEPARDDNTADLDRWVENLLSDPLMLEMGHHQRAADANLGLGWLYYALARILRPSCAVVIGSWRGFTPLILGRALQDNLEVCQLLFIDPSIVDDFWKDRAEVREYFASHGISNARHFAMTTADFTATEDYRDIASVGLVFIDGFHDYAHARFDYLAFKDKLSETGMVIFHDSVREAVSTMYDQDKPYRCDVNRFIDELKRDDTLQVMDLPFDSGITLVRKVVDPCLPAFALPGNEVDAATGLPKPGKLVAAAREAARKTPRPPGWFPGAGHGN